MAVAVVVVVVVALTESWRESIFLPMALASFMVVTIWNCSSSSIGRRSGRVVSVSEVVSRTMLSFLLVVARRRAA